MDVTAIVRPPRHARPEDLPGLAEADMLTMFASNTDRCPLTPRSVSLADGAFVQIDGVSGDEDLFVIPLSHQGSLPADAGTHLARDVFSLAAVTAERPQSEGILLFACAQARDDARDMVGLLARDCGIGFEVVDLGLGLEWTERLGEASRPVGRHRAESVRSARQALAGATQTEMVED